jgi:hypothetical protein
VQLTADTVASSTFILSLQNREAVVGAEILEETIRRALATMRAGEHSRVHVRAEYGFGGDGCAELGVAADAAIDLDLELHEVLGEAPAPVNESPEARLARAQEIKAVGTQMYKVRW